MARPSLAAMRVFEAAARLGSFKEAAGELAMTPTAVSHRIRNLEEELGQPLFRRSHRKVELTSAGVELFEAARGAVALLDAAFERLDAGARIVCVSATPAFAALWLAPRLSALAAALPGVTLRLEASHAPADLERVRDIDLAVRYGSRSPTGTGRVLAGERFRAYAAPHVAQGSPEAFDRLPLLTCRWQARDLAPVSLEVFEAHRGDGAPPALSFDDEHHAALAAVSGKGIVILSEILAGHLVEAGLLAEPWPEASVAGHAYRLLAAPASAVRRDVRRVAAWLEAELAGGAAMRERPPP